MYAESYDTPAANPTKTPQFLVYIYFLPVIQTLIKVLLWRDSADVIMVPNQSTLRQKGGHKPFKKSLLSLRWKGPSDKKCRQSLGIEWPLADRQQGNGTSVQLKGTEFCQQEWPWKNFSPELPDENLAWLTSWSSLWYSKQKTKPYLAGFLIHRTVS